MTTERTFTTAEIVKALHEARKEIDDMVLFRVISPNAGSDRRIGVIEVAEALGLDNECANYRPSEKAAESNS